MSRSIKFRCWDVYNERVVYEPDRFEPAYTEDEKLLAPYIFYETWQDREDGIRRPCHLMQFTGLLDKHGKEIYYGDLLRIKFKTQYYDLEAIYEVIDRGFTTQFLMRSLITPSEVFSDIRLNAAEDFEWFAGNRLEISHGSHNGRERSTDIEVIGDIYTTPELVDPKMIER